MTLSREELERLSETDVQIPIPEDDVLKALSSPPFIPSQTMINVRDLGAVPGSGIKPGLIYRSGTLEVVKKHPESQQWLADHVKRIFDIRSPPERSMSADPEIDGVENTWFDSSRIDGRPILDEYIEGGGEQGVEKEYLKIMDIYTPTFKAVLEHVRDRPSEPFLFHCTAGRDRTGVLAGLLQTLAGARPEDVCFDYMLSRIGTEPAREMLLQYAKMGTGIEDVTTPGFLNLVSLRASSWNAFVAGVKWELGGWDHYVTTDLGFTGEDLEKIKANLKGEGGSVPE